jgi:hypothetical protein
MSKMNIINEKTEATERVGDKPFEVFSFEVSQVNSHLWYDHVEFSPPVKIIACQDIERDGVISYHYDFGMNMELKMDELPFYIDKSASWKEAVKQSVQFDLEHTFFHPSIDPNYSPVHYALLGCLCLKGRTAYMEAVAKATEDDNVEIVGYTRKTMDWIP